MSGSTPTQNDYMAQALHFRDLIALIGPLIQLYLLQEFSSFWTLKISQVISVLQDSHIVTTGAPLGQS